MKLKISRVMRCWKEKTKIQTICPGFSHQGDRENSSKDVKKSKNVKLSIDLSQTPCLQPGVALIVVGYPIFGNRPPIVIGSALKSLVGSNFSLFFSTAAFVSTSNLLSTFLYLSAATSSSSLTFLESSFYYIQSAFFANNSYSLSLILSD